MTTLNRLKDGKRRYEAGDKSHPHVIEYLESKTPLYVKPEDQSEEKKPTRKQRKESDLLAQESK